MKTVDRIVEILKSKGLRVTPQRYAVYANLSARADHPTVDQLFHDLNQNLPLSSQATIYTSLQALRSVGLVREVLLEAGISRYDANVDPHHHFRCRGCGCIEDLDWQMFGPLQLDQVPARLQVERLEVSIEGLCDRCAE